MSGVGAPAPPVAVGRDAQDRVPGDEVGPRLGQLDAVLEAPVPRHAARRSSAGRRAAGSRARAPRDRAARPARRPVAAASAPAASSSAAPIRTTLIATGYALARPAIAARACSPSASHELARAVDDAAPAQEAVGHVVVALERDRRRPRRAAPRRSAGRRRAGGRGRRPRCSAGATPSRSVARSGEASGSSPVGAVEVERPAALHVGRLEQLAVGELAVGVAVHRGVERRVDEQLGADAAALVPRGDRGEVAAGAVAADDHPGRVGAELARAVAGGPGDGGARVARRRPDTGARARGGSRRSGTPRPRRWRAGA